MYKIAVCDDEVITCSKVEQLLFQYAEENIIRVEVVTFYSGEQFCKMYTKDSYDLVFIDIELITMSGIVVGEYIRNIIKDAVTNIIYMSSYTKCAIDLFKTRPIDFLLKPLREPKLYEALDRFFAYSQKCNQFFEFKMGRMFYKIQWKDILYFRSIGKKIHLYLVQDKGEKIFYGKLEQVKDTIDNKNFIWIHKSYLINYQNIEEYSYEQVKMIDGEILSISKIHQKSARLHFLQCAKEER